MSPEELGNFILGLSAAWILAFLLFSIVLSLPPIFILFSRRVHGGMKLLWFILTSLFSWLAYIVFLIVAPPAPKKLRTLREP